MSVHLNDLKTSPTNPLDSTALIALQHSHETIKFEFSILNEHIPWGASWWCGLAPKSRRRKAHKFVRDWTSTFDSRMNVRPLMLLAVCSVSHNINIPRRLLAEPFSPRFIDWWCLVRAILNMYIYVDIPFVSILAIVVGNIPQGISSR